MTDQAAPLPGRVADVVAKALQECQNGLPACSYSIGLPGGGDAMLEAELAGYSDRIDGRLTRRERAFDIDTAHASVAIEPDTDRLVVRARRVAPLPVAQPVTPMGRFAPSPHQTWSLVQELFVAYRDRSGYPTEKLRLLLDHPSWLVSTLACDLLNVAGEASVPAFLRTDNHAAALVAADGSAIRPTDARYTEAWEDRISVDEYALFEATHPAYGAQTFVCANYLELFASAPLDRVLDVGSGPGLPTIMLSELFENTVFDAVEPSPAAFTHLVGNAAGRNLNPIHADILDLDLGERYPAAVSVGASHHMDTRLFFRSISRQLASGGVLVVADEMVGWFSTPQQRASTITRHHSVYIDEAIRNVVVSELPAPERLRWQQLRSLTAPGSEPDLASLRELLESVRENRRMYQGLDSPWQRVRFAVLELEALVAGIDYDVERKTFASNFIQMAGQEGYQLLAHDRVYATVGSDALGSGTHVYAFRRA